MPRTQALGRWQPGRACREGPTPSPAQQRSVLTDGCVRTLVETITRVPDYGAVGRNRDAGRAPAGSRVDRPGRPHGAGLRPARRAGDPRVLVPARGRLLLGGLSARAR